MDYVSIMISIILDILVIGCLFFSVLVDFIINVDDVFSGFIRFFNVIGYFNIIL